MINSGWISNFKNENNERAITSLGMDPMWKKEVIALMTSFPIVG